MNATVQKLFAGAVSGFVAAFLVDFDAWKKGKGEPFDWSKALPRWFYGAMSGLLAAFGFGSAFGDPTGGTAPQIDA